jgi:pheromone shutdown protein TraB
VCEKLIVDRRDAVLVAALAGIHNEHHQEPIKVAIVYGAGHVTAVVCALHQSSATSLEAPTGSNS